MSKLLLSSILIFLLLSGCFVMENKYPALPPGKWRAVLKINPEFITPNPKGRPLPDKVNMTYDDVKEGELPFTFEVVYENDSSFFIDLINGQERIRVPAGDIRFGRSKERARDTIHIEFPVFDTYISGSFAGNVIEGSWVVRYRDNYAIPFVATHGKDYRFTTVRKPPVADLSGKWQATFGLSEGEQPYPAVGEFSQQGNLLTGTFLTETGDYRFLEGTVQGDQLWLSCFDGAHAYLFEAKILPGDSLIGAYYSGKHYRTTWEARRDDQAKLSHADSLTFLKAGFDKFTFAFENPDGKVISPENEEYRGKVKIIQLLGTWCPNCRDETEFLLEFLQENTYPDLAVIALAFERYSDKEKANQAIRTYKNRFGMTYEIAYAGSYKKQEAAKALPMLDQVIAFPTLIFLDKNNRVRKIHTGFSGPATSEYPAFKQEFTEFVSRLLAESR